MKNASATRTSKRPTLALVAQEAGVSKETVSHILGKKAERYHAETRQRVEEAARKLNYRPHRAAQLMRGVKSNLIGIIHFGTRHQNAARASYHLPEAIHAKGYETFVVDLSWHGGNRKRAIELLIEAGVEGVIISQMVEGFGHEELQHFTAANIPVVSLAGNEKLDIPCVYGESSEAIRQIARHLVSLGRRSLLLLANEYQSRPTLSRIAGFTKGIAEAGGQLVERLEDLHCPTDGDAVQGIIVRLQDARLPAEVGSSAYTYVRQVIEDGLLPDAILAGNDQWARAVFAAALENGIRIPEDLAVTGFDDEPFGAHAPYYLTTAVPNIRDECYKVVEILQDLIAGRPLAQQRYIFPCQVVIRRSCGAEILQPPAVSLTTL